MYRHLITFPFYLFNLACVGQLSTYIDNKYANIVDMYPYSTRTGLLASSYSIDVPPYIFLLNLVPVNSKNFMYGVYAQCINVLTHMHNILASLIESLQ